jgi:hypothetical protein
MNKFLYFKTTSEAIDAANTLVDFPIPATVLQNPIYFDHRIILPKYSFEGGLIAKKYSKLRFHFMVIPVFLDYVDFRLTDDNKYELLRFNDDAVSDFTEKDIQRAAREMEEAFDDYENEPSYYTGYNPGSEYISDKVKIGASEPVWCQSHYQRKKTAEEIAAEARNEDDDHDDYTTDYTLPIFKDENGDALQFVCELYEGNVFGSYYLFFSPKTRLVRQFFQCT